MSENTFFLKKYLSEKIISLKKNFVRKKFCWKKNSWIFSQTELCLGLNLSRTEFCLRLHTAVVLRMQSLNQKYVMAHCTVINDLFRTATRTNVNFNLCNATYVSQSEQAITVISKHSSLVPIL